MNWKNVIDRYLEEEGHRKKAETAKRAASEQKRSEAKEDAKHNDKIRRLGDSYQCYLCSYRAKSPGSEIVGYDDSGCDGGSPAVPIWGPDWGVPGDLCRCLICRSWICHNCSHKSICKECAKALATGKRRRGRTPKEVVALLISLAIGVGHFFVGLAVRGSLVGGLWFLLGGFFFVLGLGFATERKRDLIVLGWVIWLIIIASGLLWPRG